MVSAMCIRAHRRALRSTAFAFLLAAWAACGSKTAGDPKNREIPWVYGPTTATATAEHLRGTGNEGGAPIAKGWHFRLQDGKRLAVTPYQLAESHALFGKVAMGVSLFDKNSKEIAAFLSPVITAQNATFTFDLTDAVATQLWDLVIWYRKA